MNGFVKRFDSAKTMLFKHDNYCKGMAHIKSLYIKNTNNDKYHTRLMHLFC